MIPSRLLPVGLTQIFFLLLCAGEPMLFFTPRVDPMVELALRKQQVRLIMIPCVQL